MPAHGQGLIPSDIPLLTYVSRVRMPILLSPLDYRTLSVNPMLRRAPRGSARFAIFRRAGLGRELVRRHARVERPVHLLDRL